MIDKQKIFLIGYMGSGKTTIGRLLAKKLNLQFIDTDTFIENRYRKSIHDIFAEKGEVAFREIERNILIEILAFENTVIAAGGGTPCFSDNMDLMTRTGVTIYLKLSEEQLLERLMPIKHKRPLLNNKNPDELKNYISTTLAEREPIYSRAIIAIDSNELFSKGYFNNKLQRLIENLQI
jgi:shikimate kinase